MCKECQIIGFNPLTVKVAFVTKYNMKNGTEVPAILLGLYDSIRDLEYQIRGKSPIHGECYINCALDSLLTEYNITLSRQDFLNKCKDNQGKLKYVTYYSGFSRTNNNEPFVARESLVFVINHRGLRRNDIHTQHCRKFDWFTVDGLCFIPKGSNQYNKRVQSTLIRTNIDGINDKIMEDTRRFF